MSYIFQRKLAEMADQSKNFFEKKSKHHIEPNSKPFRVIYHSHSSTRLESLLIKSAERSPLSSHHRPILDSISKSKRLESAERLTKKAYHEPLSFSSQVNLRSGLPYPSSQNNPSRSMSTSKTRVNDQLLLDGPQSRPELHQLSFKKSLDPSLEAHSLMDKEDLCHSQTHQLSTKKVFLEVFKSQKIDLENHQAIRDCDQGSVPPSFNPIWEKREKIGSDNKILKSSCLSFFYPGTVLPTPSEEQLGSQANSIKRPSNEHSSLAGKASRRLQTMLSKQRRVALASDNIQTKFNQNTLETSTQCQDSSINSKLNKSLDSQSNTSIRKVRCALSRTERLLGIKWIHNVDTTGTTHPQLTPSVRYHACILFSLYWGAYIPKVVKLGDSDVSHKNIIWGSKGDREAQKKMKLIAATAMACLTLAIKWQFDCCKPLFTLQLHSFCKTTDYKSFKLTPDDLILTERAILFSYPVKGGVWIDSPHCFLEELVRIIPSLRMLSTEPPKYLQKKTCPSSRKSDGLFRQGNTKVIKILKPWVWPEVLHEFHKTLTRVTIMQEFLTFDASVLCVVALYAALEAVEPGYYQKISQKSYLKARPGAANYIPGAPVNDRNQKIESKENIRCFVAENKDHEKRKIRAGEDLGEAWLWRSIDVNDTVNQVCHVAQIKSFQVEECLSWFYEMED
ncbi:hypothetical protein O181_080932 [Austropuccinia psidii MF-1]|uniref:Uncharacterized protein n=1 Tax=Austropuccinia psidii MF-1 TaxID=1389203 RepID=A0A9Q3FPS7_9BASI|nr:hypothetical protein [Austropuccinia psidii MF-1]